MKMMSLIFIKKNVLIGFSIAAILAIAACDKIPLFKDSNENTTQNQGIVQTDWKNSSEIKIEPEPVSEKTGGVQKQSSQLQTTSENRVKQQSDKAMQPSPESKAFAVQIGAFLKKENATRLMASLRKKGYDPNLLIVETPAKKWNLVRIGSYTEKQTALEAAKNFSKKNYMETAVVQNQTIVKVQAKKSPVAVKEKAIKPPMVKESSEPQPDRFTFQVGGLRTKDNAAEYKLILQKRGYSPFIRKTRNMQTNEDWYSVRIGNFDTIEEAADNAREFTEKENIPALATAIIQ